MTKEHAYAYEAGYVDGSSHYELEHCPACKNVADLQAALAENAKLREQMERLVTLLRVDCDIDASWDGLRRFWSIGLTEDGCLMRDRACKAEAENAKLREELAKARDPQRIGGQADPSSFAYAIEQLREFRWQHATNDEEAIPYINNVAAAHERENAKLRELAADMWNEGMCECGSRGKCARCEYGYPDRMRELGVDA